MHLLGTLILLNHLATAAVPGLNIWPARIDLKLAPGELKTGAITVQNQGLSRLTLETSAMNIIMGEDGSLDFTEKPLPTGLRGWLTVKPETLEVEPRANQQVIFVLSVPPEARGTRVGAVIFRLQEGGTGGDRGIVGGTIILQTVPGTGGKKADITFLGAVKKDGLARLRIKLANTGDLVINPKIEITLSDRAGGETKYTLNQMGEWILPGCSRMFEHPLEKLPDGGFRILAQVDYGGAEILQGESVIEGFITAASTTRISEEVSRTAPARMDPGERESLIKEGTKLYAAGEYARAMEVWTKLLSAFPQDAKIKSNYQRTRQKLEALRKVRE